MEAILITLFVLALLLYFIRVSLLKNIVVIAVYVIFPAIFPYVVYPWLIEQNKKYIEFLLSKKVLMNDFALLIMLEALLVIGSVFALSKQHFNEKTKRILLGLKYVPTLTPVLTLTYFELQAFYFIRDYSFEQIAIGFLTFSVIISGIVVAGIKWLIQECEIRLELTFILCLVQVLMGIIIGSFYNSIASASILGKEIWKPFVAITIFGGAMVVIGFLYSSYRMKHKSSRTIKS